MGYRIFLSVGGQSTDAQYAFVEAFKSFLREYDMEPVTAKAGLVSPFDNINEKMRTSDGVIVLAFERYFAEKMIEYRGGNRKDRTPREHLDVSLPTTWNQVEAAFAWAWGLPLLVICEEGLREDALLERGAKWHIHRVNIANPDFDSLRDAMREMADKMRKTKHPLRVAWKRSSDSARVGLLGTFIGTILAVAGAAFALGQFLGG